MLHPDLAHDEQNPRNITLISPTLFKNKYVPRLSDIGALNLEPTIVTASIIYYQ
jgi:hypothetical protein